MRSWLVLWSLLLALPALAQEAPVLIQKRYPGEANAGPGLFVQRPVIIVSDLDRALTIWRDLLGFTVETISPAPTVNNPSAVNVWGAAPTSTFRFATLSVPGRQTRSLAIGEITGQPIIVPKSPRLAAFVVQVDGLRAKIEQLKAMGLPVVFEVVHEGEDGQVPVIEVGLEDHDGHLFVLFEENPA